MLVKIEKGPQEVLKALLSKDPLKIAEALAFQRESFRAKFGIYPEELVFEDDDESDDGRSSNW